MGSCDVAIVGGGPTGCAVGLFTARYGLETIIFDRGPSSLTQCAHLENYLGFPAGIDVETFYDLAQDHAETAGCSLVSDRVGKVDETGDGLRVETAAGQKWTADRVVAATRYDGSYLRGLDEGMFETVQRDGEGQRRFDRDYPAADGRTPIEGLYVASPSHAADRQVLIAAGHGARVGRQIVHDVRRARGYPDGVADYDDWRRRQAGLDEEWTDRDRWREWFANELPPDTAVGTDPIVACREEEIDRMLATYLSADEITARRERGQRRLLERLDDELVLERARAIHTQAEAE